MTFAQFLEQMPGMTDHARQRYVMIDEHAARIGAELAKRMSAADLRAQAEDQERHRLFWLAERNREQADALDTDVRLAAIPALRAWAAMPSGIGNSWINFYVSKLKAHIFCAAATNKRRNR